MFCNKLQQKCSEFIHFHCPRRSLAVGHQYSSLGSQPILCGSIPGLVPKQLRFCRNYVEIMPSVAEGVKIGIQECQHQFRGRRWNCTTINDNVAIFGPVLDKGTTEPLHWCHFWQSVSTRKSAAAISISKYSKYVSSTNILMCRIYSSNLTPDRQL